MKLSISNIAWRPQVDDEMYRFLQEYGYSGIEIAPTRLFPDAPYDHCGEAQAFAVWLKETYGLAVSSMQSICCLLYTSIHLRHIFRTSIVFSRAICTGFFFFIPGKYIISAF